MFFYFLYPLHTVNSFFNVFKYITFRTFGASMTAVLFCMLIGPWFIRYVQKKQLGQHIRDDGPKSHLSKKGTPTMGGGLVLLSILVSVLLWADLSNVYIWITLFVMFGFGLIGCCDDYLKVIQKNTKGLSFKQKIISQVLVSLCATWMLLGVEGFSFQLYFPFFKTVVLPLGSFFVPFAILVIVGTSNAVNLTDGLDGLAVGPMMTTGVTFLILCYCAGHLKIAEYLQIPFISGSGELAVFCGALWASCLGFLWFNTYPAQIFMGDIGSLALGAALGVVSIISKNEILLVLCGGIFVIEALSVITQVFCFKVWGKRVFKMAPIHHHFELKGWPEPKVIVRFWIVSILLALFTLSTLKLR
jgi:phospho-N-acetylmuramoyl-pentapeptide-transferase